MWNCQYISQDMQLIHAAITCYKNHQRITKIQRDFFLKFVKITKDQVFTPSQSLMRSGIMFLQSNNQCILMQINQQLSLEGGVFIQSDSFPKMIQLSHKILIQFRNQKVYPLSKFILLDRKYLQRLFMSLGEFDGHLTIQKQNRDNRWLASLRQANYFNNKKVFAYDTFKDSTNGQSNKQLNINIIQKDNN
ncbi:hypothetical protein pb186bvf_010459 [Paramecium bursaria]